MLVLGVLGIFAAQAASCATTSADPAVEVDAAPDANARGRDAEGSDGPVPNDASLDAQGSDARPRDSGSGDAHLDADSAKGVLTCTADSTFPFVFTVAEASGAAEVALTGGVRELLVASDSGHAGAALAIALPGGQKRALTLPLDAAASDDIEGIAWHDGRLYAITSSGAFRRFSPNGAGGLTRDIDATPIGASPYSCGDLTAVNCGKNYEGLCLRSAAAVAAKTHACAGYAASKAEGALYCLVLDAQGHLVASTTVPPLSLGLPVDHLSDCAFGAAGGPADTALLVVTNALGGSLTYRVDESSGSLTKLAMASVGNEEAVAIDNDGSIYVFDDNSTSFSTAAKALCSGW